MYALSELIEMWVYKFLAIWFQLYILRRQEVKHLIDKLLAQLFVFSC